MLTERWLANRSARRTINPKSQLLLIFALSLSPTTTTTSCIISHSYLSVIYFWAECRKGHLFSLVRWMLTRRPLDLRCRIVACALQQTLLWLLIEKTLVGQFHRTRLETRKQIEKSQTFGGPTELVRFHLSRGVCGILLNLAIWCMSGLNERTNERVGRYCNILIELLLASDLRGVRISWHVIKRLASSLSE